MPGKDGTGPFGTGPLGCGRGPCARTNQKSSFFGACRRFFKTPLFGRGRKRFK